VYLTTTTNKMTMIISVFNPAGYSCAVETRALASMFAYYGANVLVVDLDILRAFTTLVLGEDEQHVVWEEVERDVYDNSSKRLLTTTEWAIKDQPKRRTVYDALINKQQTAPTYEVKVGDKHTIDVCPGDCRMPNFNAYLLSRTSCEYSNINSEIALLIGNTVSQKGYQVVLFHLGGAYNAVARMAMVASHGLVLANLSDSMAVMCAADCAKTLRRDLFEKNMGSEINLPRIFSKVNDDYKSPMASLPQPFDFILPFSSLDAANPAVISMMQSLTQTFPTSLVIYQYHPHRLCETCLITHIGKVLRQEVPMSPESKAYLQTKLGGQEDLAKFDKQQQWEEDKRDLFYTSFDHAYTCRKDNCVFTHCQCIKEVFEHAANCKVGVHRKEQQCGMCAQYWHMFVLHNKKCETKVGCKVLHCKMLNDCSGFIVNKLKLM
jgi:hypothetical protein